MRPRESQRNVCFTTPEMHAAIAAAEVERDLRMRVVKAHDEWRHEASREHLGHANANGTSDALIGSEHAALGRESFALHPLRPLDQIVPGRSQRVTGRRAIEQSRADAFLEPG